VTSQIVDLVARSGVQNGICHLYVTHTTAGIVINENDDPDVGRDILEWLDGIVPRDAKYHHLEGNAHAHIKATLVGQTATVPIEEGRLALGRWQAIFFAEFDGPRERSLVVTITSDGVVREA
jgi:secondary thiamine-phosphate synthase enzyme